MKGKDQVAALRALATEPHPDARLLAICDRLTVILDEQDQLWRRTPPGCPVRSDALFRVSELSRESEPLMKELVKRRARTAAGRMAKGEIAARGMIGGAVWTDLARSALQDYRNAGQASETIP
jgi:hypothetical protein